MARDIPIGNGDFLVTFDRDYQIRDVYYPHVGQENHAGGAPSRFGVWAGGKMAWTTQGWTKRLRYLPETMVTSVSLDHSDLKVALQCNDVVDFHRPLMVRKVKVKNLLPQEREVSVIFHQDFGMFETKMGDTVYYDPHFQAMIHYRRDRYLMATCYVDGHRHIDEYATGASGFRGAEGTWRDAEDGHLQGNAIAQGAVDSTISVRFKLSGYGEQVFYYLLGAGRSRDDLHEFERFLNRVKPQEVIDRTGAYWRLWANGNSFNFGNLPPAVVQLFKRSLLVVRTQIDNNGAIIAANDTDIMQFARDTYSYLWPRDGALIAHAMDLAGFPIISRSFYRLCNKLITPEGYFLHKYNPDGTPASSWHPWVVDGQQRLPVQEDETALVVWALWRHYYRYRDTEFIRPLIHSLVEKAADWMTDFRDPQTGLPQPSYDLWEERWGVHLFTVAATYGALQAARSFMLCFGMKEPAQRYANAAEEIRAGAANYMYSEKLDRFVRRLIVGNDGRIDIDETIDSSMAGVFQFGLFGADDPRVQKTMQMVEQRLWVKTRVGGMARYENDYYHQVVTDSAAVPGNPWFICTVWLAQYFIERAKTTDELRLALPVFEWIAAHSVESGILAEQVHPHTNEPLSVSPLTWSHGGFINAVVNYLEKLEQLQRCKTCAQPLFRLRRGGIGDRSADAMAGLFDSLEPPAKRDELHPIGTFESQGKQVTVAIDQRDCIGCGVCVNHCNENILDMYADKAYVDLDTLQDCTVCRDCEPVCPTGVVKVLEE